MDLVKRDVLVAELNATHPTLDVERSHDLWALYAGGRYFDAGRFLPKHEAEPQRIYEERKRRAFYLGYVGQIVDHMVAELFRKVPRVSAANGRALPEWYATTLLKDADGTGTSFHGFLRERVTRELAQGGGWTWVDLPELGAEEIELLGDEPSLEDLDARGAREAYLIPVDVTELIDWDSGSDGFRWARIHKVTTDKPDPFAAKRYRVHVWTTLTETHCARHVAREEIKHEKGAWVGAWDAKGAPSEEKAVALSVSPHPFGRVPLLRARLPEAMCIGEKLYSVQRHLVDVDNAIAWQLFRSHFAQLVLKSILKRDVIMSESFALKLEPGDEASYLEPSGESVAIALERRETLKDELHRIVHQMSLAADGGGSNVSGETKKRDKDPLLTVLTDLGARTRDYATEVLELVARGRQEPGAVDFEVAGFDDFDIADIDAFLDRMVKASTLQVPSDTYKREVATQIAVRLLGDDVSDEALEKIRTEIEAADFEDVVDALAKRFAEAGGGAPKRDASKDDAE